MWSEQHNKWFFTKNIVVFKNSVLNKLCPNPKCMWGTNNKHKMTIKPQSIVNYLCLLSNEVDPFNVLLIWDNLQFSQSLQDITF